MWTSVPFTNVNITRGFWHQIQQRNTSVTLPAIWEACEKTGRIAAWCLQKREGGEYPHLFWDSDMAKLLEAIASVLPSLKSDQDQQLWSNRLKECIGALQQAQCPDGYFNSYFQITNQLFLRWTNLRDNHELYCAGHLIEAAVIHYQVTQDPSFLEVARKFADLLTQTFGSSPGQIPGYCGHPEIELALVKLYEVTKEKRYLELAKFFIDERGQQGKNKPHYYDLEAKNRGEDPAKFWAKTYEYNQSHCPVREQEKMVGHAVRALYLYRGMLLVGKYTNDPTLILAVIRLWNHLVQTRLGITGGVGPNPKNEGMSCDYDLPEEGSYFETCAGIALVLLAYELFLVTGDTSYLDVLEQTLYNNVLAGISESGDLFFYGNPLAAYPGFDGNGDFQSIDYHYRRSPWFGCACCPPNIARLIAQVGGLAFAVQDNALLIGLPMESVVQTTLNGQQVKVQVETQYPWKNQIKIKILETSVQKPWKLAIRIPRWSLIQQVHIKSSRSQKTKQTEKKHILYLTQCWQPGDCVEFELSMDVQIVRAHPYTRQVYGKLAFQRGPIIYCFEEAYNFAHLSRAIVPIPCELKIVNQSFSLGTFPCIHVKIFCEDLTQWKHQLYRAETISSLSSPDVTHFSSLTYLQGQYKNLKGIPYFLWGNRQPGEMRIFLPFSFGLLPNTTQKET